MSNANIGEALGRIAARGEDLLGAYQSGFEPHFRDIAASPHIEASMDPLSVAAPEGTYFILSDGGRSGTMRYSRDGSFTLRDGMLRDADGLAVMGRGTQGAALVPLKVDPVDLGLGSVQNLRIERDGSLCYTREVVDPRTGQRRSERVSVARIALARFPAGTLPVRLDRTHLQAPEGVVPHTGIPADGNFPMLLTNARDMGTVDMFSGLSRLQEAYASLEALRAARDADDGVVKTTMGLLK